MNKAVLIIDVPNSCVTCPLSCYSDFYNGYQCRGTYSYKEIEDYEWQITQTRVDDSRPDWCPLLLLPEQELLWHQDGEVVMTGGIKK